MNLSLFLVWNITFIWPNISRLLLSIMQNLSTSFCLSESNRVSELLSDLPSELLSDLLSDLLSELVSNLVTKLVSKLVSKLVPKFGLLNVIQTNNPSVPYSGSGKPTFLQASIILFTPVPQLSKKAVLNSASAIIGFCGYERCGSLMVSTVSSLGRCPVFSISTRSSKMAMPTLLLVA